MLTYEQILELMERFERSDLTAFELRDDEFRLRFEQGAAGIAALAPVAAAVGASEPAPPQPPNDGADGGSGSTPAEREPEGTLIESPIVGTFYAAPSPEAAAFVSIGDRVEVGQVICIVEAMKMMNEIEADTAGEVLEILANNGEPIGHGDPILRLLPDGGPASNSG